MSEGLPSQEESQWRMAVALETMPLPEILEELKNMNKRLREIELAVVD